MVAISYPATLAIQVEGIPSELKALDPWVLWRYEERLDSRTGESKNTKVPHLVAGARASSTDAATWTTFERALAAYQRGGFSGIGFVVTLEAGIVGVDLDHCRNPETGVIEPWAHLLVDRLGSYSEITPSRTGLRIFVYGHA